MSMVKNHLLKLREERVAREKARIEKLREINLKKYNKNEVISSAQPQKLSKSNSISQIKTSNDVNNIQLKRPATAPYPKKTSTVTNNVEPKLDRKTNYLQKNITALKNIDTKVNNKPDKDTKSNADSKVDSKPTITNKINNDRLFDRKPAVKTVKILAEIKPFKKIDPKLTRKSLAVNTNIPTRKSMLKTDLSKESVFDRLYKPKYNVKKPTNDVEKIQNDPNYLKKVIKSSGLILKRHTCFEQKEVKEPHVRRSISAVHFKRISKNELSNCIHKWASIGDKLNKQDLTLDEGPIKEEQVFSAVKSERKRVKFMTPMSKFNTPKPDELQTRLKSWLQKRGKSLDSYHHLQCFGIHHLPKSRTSHFEPYGDENKENNAVNSDSNINGPMEPTTSQYEAYDDENKENIALDSDSDDGSYNENINQKDALSQGDTIDIDVWRRASLAESIQTDCNETTDFNETTVTSADTFVNLDDLLVGALNDLTELLNEGFSWEQSARYLRAILTRWPSAPRLAAYWECRAALETRRGDLHASVSCWEEAIAKGTERNVVEANLDTLLNKFMQLQISPNRVSKQPDPKMVDVKNVFKSTIIRFAVQQAKLRQSETPLFTVTPVRRSGRLSLCPTPRGNTPHGNKPYDNTPHGNKPHGNTTRGNKLSATPNIPLRLCDSVKQVNALTPKYMFTPNKNLFHTP